MDGGVPRHSPSECEQAAARELAELLGLASIETCYPQCSGELGGVDRKDDDVGGITAWDGEDDVMGNRW